MMEDEKNEDFAFKIPSQVSTLLSGVTNKSRSHCEDTASETSVKTELKNYDQAFALPYKEPSWTGVPTDNYSFEVIKSGVIISSFPVKKSYIVIGRLPTCDISLEHPSVSRYHAVLQYCNGSENYIKGYYIYDLKSTHGTFLNKTQITPETFYLVKSGHMLKFGGSTRLHIFQAPEIEEENTSKEQKADVHSVDKVCDWGMMDDAEDDDNDLAVNPFAVCTENEELYIDDPKKTLRGWFEREGYELEYNVEERGFKTFACNLKLPIDTPTGEFLNVEASVQGKKKEAVVACALEACRTLDRYGLLRQSHQSSRERKRKNWESEDFYDSDEDTYLDRTGTIEKKRQFRMTQVKKTEPETFNSLEKKLMQLNENISNIQTKLQLKVPLESTEVSKTDDDDPLDSYMSEMDSESVDKVTKSKLKLELSELLQEKVKVEKLLNIVKPTQLPTCKFPNMIGKRLKSKLKLPPPKPRTSSQPKDNYPEVEEDDDDEEEEVKKETAVGGPEKQEIKANEKQFKYDSFDTNKSTTEEMSSVKERVKTVVTKFDMKEVSKSSSPNSKKIDKKRVKTKESNKDIYKTSNENYSMWMPPTDQSGDGSTHLNFKFGY